VDFTNMTRWELWDWMNSQISSGKMTVEESSPFLAMTLVGENKPDDTRFDFMQLACWGIDYAITRNDKVTLKMLEFAVQIMQEANVRA
jgi:hypothetical protein